MVIAGFSNFIIFKLPENREDKENTSFAKI